MRPSPHSMMGSDSSALDGVRLPRAGTSGVGVQRQVPPPGRLVSPDHRRRGVLGLIPPLAHPPARRPHDPRQGHRAQVTVLGSIMIGAAFANAALSLAERWLSSGIGEGLIYDLRVALFDHVQRMPIAFFTRTQTGALISRHEQRRDRRAAAPSPARSGSVVSNVVVLVTTLIAMVVLEWRLTLRRAGRCCRVFVMPAKRVGRRLQAITREGFDLNASMNTHDDRAVQRVRRAAGEAVRPPATTSPTSSPTGPGGCATSACAARCTAARSSSRSALVGAVGTAAVYRHRRPARDQRRDLARHPRGARRLRHPDLHAAHEPHQRPGRPHDGVRLVRPGVRGARRAQRHRRPARRRRPDRPGGTDRARRRVVPLPGGHDVSRGVARGGRAADRCPTTPARSVLTRHLGRDRAGPARRAGRPVRCGQDHASARSMPRLYDVTGGARPRRRHTTCATSPRRRCATPSAWSARTRTCSTSRSATTCATPAPTPPTTRSRPPAGPPRSTTSSPRCPTATTRSSASAGYRLSGGEKQRLAIARMLLKDPAIVDPRRGDQPPRHRERACSCRTALAAALPGRTSIVIAHRLSTITRRRPDPRARRGRDRRARHATTSCSPPAASTPTSTARWFVGRRPGPEAMTGKRSGRPPSSKRGPTRSRRTAGR